MVNPIPQPPPPPECPRCGYDLTGQVETWTEACPLHGICSECGLHLDFASILDEARARKWRFFEVAERRLFNALWVTARRALFPARFWGWVRMEHRINAPRAWGGAVAGMLGLYIPPAIVVAAILALIEYLPPRLKSNPGWWWRRSYLEHLGSNLQRTLNPLLEYGYGDWLSRSVTHAIIAYLVLFITPFTFLLLPDTLRAAKVRKRHLVRITAWSIIAPPLLLLSLGTLATFAGEVEVLISGDASGRVAYFAWNYQGRLFAALTIGWLILWWFHACRGYLKLPRPLAIAAAMITIATLLAVLITLFIPGAFVPLTT